MSSSSLHNLSNKSASDLVKDDYLVQHTFSAPSLSTAASIVHGPLTLIFP